MKSLWSVLDLAQDPYKVGSAQNTVPPQGGNNKASDAQTKCLFLIKGFKPVFLLQTAPAHAWGLGLMKPAELLYQKKVKQYQYQISKSSCTDRLTPWNSQTEDVTRRNLGRAQQPQKMFFTFYKEYRKTLLLPAIQVQGLGTLYKALYWNKNSI